MKPEQGLLRTLPFEESGKIVADLNVLYEDIYTSLEEARESMRDLEALLDAILYGEDRNPDARGRINMQVIC